jgi:hypothetical protein
LVVWGKTKRIVAILEMKAAICEKNLQLNLPEAIWQIEYFV